MKGKRRRLLLAAIDPMLEPGERVEVTTIVNLSSVTVPRTAAFAAVTAILSGGGMAVIPVPTPMCLGMTDRRIFIFRANPTFARSEEHLMTIARRSPLGDQGAGAQLVFRHLLGDSEQGLRIVFPLAGRAERNVVAAALPRAD
ncbi:hypothetical protein [Streptomyces sp. YIM 132580]|uniref:hypothetical protein n=1 Tax=Streptomyces sp. YIM 132580 TaxID=2691958 RepID=UPI001F171CEE|nr:hypothetical protein [Streptomyces sp. YIM 132580]